MKSPITGYTELNMIVNGNCVFTIRNNPVEGLIWSLKSSTDRHEIMEGLFAIIEASHNISVNKIISDAPRVLNCRDAVSKG